MKILLAVGFIIALAGGMVWWNIGSYEEPPEGTQETNDEPATDSTGTTLNLSGKGLTKVSADVFSETKLTELDLSNNKLTGSLQAEIRLLQNLKTLDLSDNQFTGVPAEIGQLQSLEILDLSNNQLTGLPHELGNLSSLKQLNLSGNDYSEADLSIIKEGLPSSTVITVD